MFTFAEGYVINEIYKADGMPEMIKAKHLIHTYLCACEDYYESKRIRIEIWNPDEGEINELIIAIFTLCLTEEYLTYPSITGMLADRIKADLDPFDRVKCVAEIIALMAQADVLDIDTQRSVTARISTRFMLPNIPQRDQHLVFTDAEEITSNYHETYGSMLLGGKLKHHEKPICVEHLNKRNAIELSLNIPLLCNVNQQASKPLDTQKKRDQWDLFVRECYNKSLEIVKHHGNKFHLIHKYDCRGRAYCNSYYINYQGTAFQKAVVQLANKEVVTT